MVRKPRVHEPEGESTLYSEVAGCWMGWWDPCAGSSGLSPKEPRAPTQSRLAAEARPVVGRLASELGSVTLVAIGEEAGRAVSTISSAVRWLSRRAGRDAVSRGRLDAIAAR